jgi:acetyltransferase-like isoleucine patch superfamily enzyme
LKKWFAGFLGFRFGQNSYMHGKIKFFGFKRVTIGNYSVINPGCYIDNRKPINIGNCVNISHDVRLYTLGHDIDAPDFAIKGEPIIIDDYVCIFANVMIMPGVHLGKGAVVYPGSVVTKDVAPFTVVGGNPARVIRSRSENINYKHSYGFWLV